MTSKRTSKRGTKKAQADLMRQGPPEYHGPSITTYELSRQNQITSPDYELVARGIKQSIYAAANFNATVCASQKLRLFRPVKSSGLKSIWPGRKVTDRKVLAYLKGDGPTNPHHKAMAIASSAKELEEVLDHPILDLLRQPDPNMTGTQWMWYLYWFNEVAGRAFVYKGQRLGTEPVAAYVLPPQYTRIVPDPTFTRLFKSVVYGIEYMRKKEYDAEDVIYVRHQIHPQRPLEAVSWLQSVVLYSDVENAAIQAEVNRWGNGGQPQMVVEVPPGTNDPQIDQIRANLARQMRGPSKAGQPLIIRASKVDWGVPPHEMHYVEGMEEARKMIYLAAGIPETMWKMADSNRASAVAGDPQYFKCTVNPRCSNMAETLTVHLLPDFEGTDEWVIVNDDPVKEDREMQRTEVTTLVDMGMMTQNQGLSTLGYEVSEDPALDVYRYHGQPLAAPMAEGEETDAEPVTDNVESPSTTSATLQNLVRSVMVGESTREAAKAIAAIAYPNLPPEKLSAIFDGLEEPEDETTEAEDGTQAQEDASEGDQTGTADNGGSGGTAESDSGGPDAESPDAETSKPSGKNLVDAEHAPDEPGSGHDCGHVHTKELGSGEADAHERDLAKALALWYDRVIAARLNSIHATGTPDGGAVVSPDATVIDLTPAESAELERIVQDGIAKIYSVGAKESLAGMAGIGPSVPLDYSKAIEYAQQRAGELIKNISDEAIGRLRDQVAGAVERGESLGTLQSALQSDGYSQYKAELIARTESSMAYNEGILKAFAESGVETKVWLLSPDPCPICQAIADEYNADADIPLGQAFYGAGTKITGADGTSITLTKDLLAPPAHPNCRCTLNSGKIRGVS